MPQTNPKNATPAVRSDVSQPTAGRQPTAGAGVGGGGGGDSNQPPAWRHHAEQRLVALARELDDAIDVMASLDGAVDVTMPGAYRVEVRDQNTGVVTLQPPCPEWDHTGKAWLPPHGTTVLGRVLTAVGEALAA